MNRNEFFDINKFPKDWGIIILGISMSRTSNTQSPTACMEALDHLVNKVAISRVGANFIYSEGLYMNFENNAFETKNHFAQAAVSHMGAVRNLVQKNRERFQIDHAFSFESWFQMYLSHPDFFSILKKVKDFYATDPKFQQWVVKDSEEQGKELNERQLAFYLEEHTWEYLLLNRQLKLRNEFVNDREQWVLFAYPGKPSKAQIYLYQQDPLKLNDDSNPYKGQYDLDSKKFIDYTRVELESF